MKNVDSGLYEKLRFVNTVAEPELTALKYSFVKALLLN